MAHHPKSLLPALAINWTCQNTKGQLKHCYDSCHLLSEFSQSWMPLLRENTKTLSKERLTVIRCASFSPHRDCGHVKKAAGYVKDLETELYIYPTVALSMKHSLWPSVLSDITMVYTRKVTADLWLRHKCTKRPGLYQDLSDCTVVFRLIHTLYLDSDCYLGKWYMNCIYLLVQTTPKDYIWEAKSCMSPQTASIKNPF